MLKYFTPEVEKHLQSYVLSCKKLINLGFTKVCFVVAVLELVEGVCLKYSAYFRCPAMVCGPLSALIDVIDINLSYI